MPKKTTYLVRDGAGDHVAGRRVKPGSDLELTEEQARYPLIARQIEEVERAPATSVEETPPLEEPDAPARKGRRKTTASET